MKLILENWNKFLNEGEIDEGATAAAKVAAMLAGLGLNTTAPEDMDTGAYDTDAPTHQVEYEPEPEAETSQPELKINTLINNKDGTYSIIIPTNPNILKLSNQGMADDILRNDARRALANAVKGQTTTSQTGNTSTTRQITTGTLGATKIAYLDSNLKPAGMSDPKNIKYTIITGDVR